MMGIDFTTLMSGGVLILPVIFGLVEFSKSLGLSGKWLTVFSMLLGIAFGFRLQDRRSGYPAGFAGWFLVTVFGLALGLIASGFYDFIDKRTTDITRLPK